MSDIPEEPPDDNEQYEQLDEALDEEDVTGEGPGPEGQRDLDSELVVDTTVLEEAGANLDDPDRISVLRGAMDDPDGTGPPEDRDDAQAGWDVDRLTAETDDSTEAEDDAELEEIDVDPGDMEQFPDDAPGADSARW